MDRGKRCVSQSIGLKPETISGKYDAWIQGIRALFMHLKDSSIINFMLVKFDNVAIKFLRLRNS